MKDLGKMIYVMELVHKYTQIRTHTKVDGNAIRYIRTYTRAVYRNFAKGGKFGVWTKEGGGRRAEAQWYHARCYTLGGARMTQGGANARPPP